MYAEEGERMLQNKQKIIQHFSALFIKAMVLGF